MLAALVALAGIFVALYLTLYKLGYIGTLACAVGSCEKVQTSKWATMFGYPYRDVGMGYYVGILAIALAGTTAALADRRGVSQLLLALTTFGLLFSLWLTYLELAVIDAICQWCVISADPSPLRCSVLSGSIQHDDASLGRTRSRQRPRNYPGTTRRYYARLTPRLASDASLSRSGGRESSPPATDPSSRERRR